MNISHYQQAITISSNSTNNIMVDTKRLVYILDDYELRSQKQIFVTTNRGFSVILLCG